MIYLDHAATTPVRKEVLEAVTEAFEIFGNPSSLHAAGTKAREAVEESRETLARALRCSPEEVVFTSGGTEANNLALKGLPERGHVLVSSIEHPSVLEPAGSLEKLGFEVERIPVDRFGLVDPERVAEMIRKDTVLVSVMHANNEIGTVQPVREIGKVCRDSGVLLHVDAVQTFGKIEVDPKRMNADLVSVSSHKIYGPKGVGALFVREGVKLKPLLSGGGQERGLRSGTENVQGIVGFAKAAELAVAEMETESRRLERLRDRLISGLSEIPDSFLNGHPKKRLPNNAHFCFRFIEGESAVLMLSEEGIMVSTASACSSRKLEPSHVLRAIGLRREEAHGSVRYTLGLGNTKEQVEKAIEATERVVEKLREISPFKGKW